MQIFSQILKIYLKKISYDDKLKKNNVIQGVLKNLRISTASSVL